MTVLDITAADISCEHCKATIEHDLGDTPGVRAVVVDVAARAVHVDYDDSETNAAALRSRLAEIGYPAS